MIIADMALLRGNGMLNSHIQQGTNGKKECNLLEEGTSMCLRAGLVTRG